MNPSVSVYLSFRADLHDDQSLVEAHPDTVGRRTAGILRITRLWPIPTMEDTQMTDSRPLDQQPLESQSLQRDLNMQVVEGLHQVMTDLRGLHDKFGTLPNDVVALLRSSEADLLRRVPTEDNTRVENLDRRLTELNAQNANLMGENESMKSAVQAAQRDQDSLRLAIKKHEDVFAQQNRVLHQRDQEIYTLRTEMDKLRQKESALRTIILDKAGTQKASDQEVTSKFANLHRRIETIARAPIYQMDRVPLLTRKTGDKDQFAFFDDKFWGRLTQDERTKRVISKIFDFIHLNILDFPLFGAEGMELGDGKGKGTGKFLAPGLRYVEQALEARGVPDNLISSWRILTIDCFDKLKPPVPYVARVVGEDIYEFLRPLLVKSIQHHQEDELRAKFLELCTEAFDLRMIMRRSTDRYTCEVPGFGGWPPLASQCEQLAETVAVEGGRPNQASDEIAYTLFGGLVKQAAEYGDGKKKVLEKALVILKKK